MQRARRRSSATELSDFTVREGAYYGNIFQTETQTLTDGSQVEINTPEYFACAGPGSNIPQLTLRFCSSQGSNCPINVVGVCKSPSSVQASNDFSTCQGDDGVSLAMSNCHEVPKASDGTWPDDAHKEVITVFLKEEDPILACGNAVCEKFENDTSNCPSDCRSGTWAHSLGNGLIGPLASGLEVVNRGLVVAPDDTVIVSGELLGTSSLDPRTRPSCYPDTPRKAVRRRSWPSMTLTATTFGLGA